MADRIRGIGTGFTGLFYGLVLQERNAAGKKATGKQKSGRCSHNPGLSESYYQP
jgi:hypothetical protein